MRIIKVGHFKAFKKYYNDDYQMVIFNFFLEGILSGTLLKGGIFPSPLLFTYLSISQYTHKPYFIL